jgi:hypothetical protein
MVLLQLFDSAFARASRSVPSAATTTENSESAADNPTVLSSINPLRPRISAGNEMPLADHLPEEQQKQRGVSRSCGMCAALAIILFLSLGLWARPLAAAAGIGIELNRLEEQGPNCRAYLVVANPGETAFSSFKLDLVIFDRSGTIMRRLALDLAPLHTAKTSVKVFDITDTPCAGIGSILVNDVVDCRDAKGAVPDCIDRVSASSKLAVSLSK